LEVALHRILVVDDSPAVRETLAILLGGDYEVEAVPTAALSARGTGSIPSLVIAARAPALTKTGVGLPPGVPVLWMDPLVAGSGGEPPATPFSPRRLRAQVAALLARPVPAGRGRDRLDSPFIPAAVASVVADALRVPLPLHLVGEPGVGKRALARAIHDGAKRGAFVAVTGGSFELTAIAAAAPAGGTLFIDRVNHLSGNAQEVLLAGLDPSGHLSLAADRSLRIISSATDDLGDAVDTGTFSPDLYYRLTTFSVRLPALRERADDLPALAEQLAAEIAAALGRRPVSFTDEARTRLRHYLWFGNLSELEAVLARSIALAPGPVLDAGDLRFEARPTPPAAAAPAQAHDALVRQSLDLIINELAHEFKNPLVTIKTFAHHLRRASPKGGDEAQVARLTGEAVEQIDQTLENLLEFTRLDQPAARALSLASLLDPVLADCTRALAARGVRLDHDALPSVGVRGDPEQLAYALSNLVRSVARDLSAGARVRISFAPPASIVVELPNGAAPFARHLATLLDRPADAAHALPLGVAIANAVLERNGARVAVADEAPFTVSVRFALADAEESVAAHDPSPRSGR
jgi:DNA-binding NtrC family response regulator